MSRYVIGGFLGFSLACFIMSTTEPKSRSVDSEQVRLEKAIDQEDMTCKQAGFDQPLWKTDVLGADVKHRFFCVRHRDNLFQSTTVPQCNTHNLSACSAG